MRISDWSSDVCSSDLQGLDQGGTALQKNDGVLRRNRHQLTQVTLGLGSQVDERLAAMTEFHHRGALAVPLQQLVLSLTQYRLGQSRRTGAEVMHARHGDSVTKAKR